MKRDLCFAPKIFLLADASANADGLAQIFRAAGVEVALLFGSLARGASEGGDLDLAVLFSESGKDPADLREAVCQLFGADNVDILVLDCAPFLLRKRALLEGRVLYDARPTTLPTLTEDVLFIEPDFRHSATMLDAHLRQRLRGALSMAERRLDRQRVIAYLSQLDVSVRKLAVLRRRFGSLEQFRTDEDSRDLATHHVRIALECVLDIGRHVLAVKGVSLHELDTTNLIELAGVKGLLTVDFARRIRGMAGLRNAIVHAYVGLNYEAIYRMLADRLGDFDEFGRQVLGYLEREQNEPA